MGRPRECSDLVCRGARPSEIAGQFGITIGSVNQYLWRAVGEGLLQPYQILLSFPRVLREAVETAVHAQHAADINDVQRHLASLQISVEWEELELLWTLTTSRARELGLYQFLSTTENLLHTRLRAILVEEYGPEEHNWWRKGVPLNVRIDCVKARETDVDGNTEPYGYTTLIHLVDILDKQWRLFQPRLPQAFASDKPAFLEDLRKLNAIRNCAMHPTRLDRISDEDFSFARDMHRRLLPEEWRSRASS